MFPVLQLTVVISRYNILGEIYKRQGHLHIEAYVLHAYFRNENNSALQARQHLTVVISTRIRENQVIPAYPAHMGTVDYMRAEVFALVIHNSTNPSIYPIIGKPNRNIQEYYIQ